MICEANKAKCYMSFSQNTDSKLFTAATAVTQPSHPAKCAQGSVAAMHVVHMCPKQHHCLTAFFRIGVGAGAFFGAAAAAAATFFLWRARVHLAFCGTSTASPPAAWIFSLADVLNLAALMVNFKARSPSPSTWGKTASPQHVCLQSTCC